MGSNHGLEGKRQGSAVTPELHDVMQSSQLRGCQAIRKVLNFQRTVILLVDVGTL
jgi:hypothetical protein